MISKCESVCQRCDEYYPYPDIHHVDGNPKNNIDDNLMVCCPNCHRLLDYKLRYGHREIWV